MNFPSKPWSNGQTAELVAGSTFVYDSTKDAWLLSISTEQANINSLQINIDSDTGAIYARLSTAEGDITTINSDISAILARLDSDYALNNQKHAVQEALITANSNAITTANARADADSDALVAVEARVTALETDVDDNVADIATLRADADSDTARIQELSVTAAANAATITATLAMLDSDGTVLQNLQTQIDAIGTGSLAAIEADHDSDIAVVNSSISAVENSVTTLETKVDANEVSHDSDIGAVQSSVTAVENSVTTLDTKVDAVAADLDSEITVVNNTIVEAGAVYKGTTPPASPNANDLWYDTATSLLFSWDASNSVWVQVIS